MSDGRPSRTVGGSINFIGGRGGGIIDFSTRGDFYQRTVLLDFTKEQRNFF